MSKETIVGRVELSSNKFDERVMRDIGSLREELVTIRQLLERGHSLDQAIKEYCYLPSDLKNPIRFGFIGAWGKGGSNSIVHINTNTEDNYFNDPDGSDENVAALAAAFTNPNTIKVCRYLFRNRENSREDIKKGCNLSDEELDVAVKPLLEWRFVAWKDGRLEHSTSDLGEHGVYYAVMLIGFTKSAFAYKERQEQK